MANPGPMTPRKEDGANLPSGARFENVASFQYFKFVAKYVRIGLLPRISSFAGTGIEEPFV